MKEQLQFATDLIEDILSKINNLPMCWDEFLGEELADDIIDFMAENSGKEHWKLRKEEREDY